MKPAAKEDPENLLSLDDKEVAGSGVGTLEVADVDAAALLLLVGADNGIEGEGGVEDSITHSLFWQA